MLVRNVQVKRERSEILRQDRCCKVELQINVTGKTGKAFAALKLSQKTCLLSVYRILRTKE